MLRPKFSIAHQRYRPADEPASFYVHGACGPPSYDTLAEARLFVARENSKYRNGRVIAFYPTHMILWQPPASPAVRRRIPVRMISIAPHLPSALYTEDEWKPCVIPEWTYDLAAGHLILEGILMGNSWRLLTYLEGLANFAVFAAREKRDNARFLAW